eukprot:1159888-Pelagomonas_calceolata.AAC.3
METCQEELYSLRGSSGWGNVQLMHSHWPKWDGMQVGFCAGCAAGGRHYTSAIDYRGGRRMRVELQHER